MGNMQGSHEISVEEQEQFEMQVEEDYNPTVKQSEKEAKLQYLQRLRKREAEDFRLKYLGVKAVPVDDKNSNPNINEFNDTLVG